MSFENGSSELGLPSNDGRSSTTFRVKSASGALVLLEIEVTSQFWDRSREPFEPGLVPDHSLQLFQVRCAPRGLDELCTALERWLAAQEPFSIDLGADAGQSLTVRIGPHPGLIHSRYKPVFAAVYDAGPAARIEWAYLVDPSCIQLLFDQLRESLRDGEPGAPTT